MTLLSNSAKSLIEKIRDCVRPPKDISIPDWVKENRNLPAAAAAESGPMDIASRTPYLVELCKAIRSKETSNIVLMTSAQVAKTELLNNAMFYLADVDPGPMMFILPTKEFVKAFSKEKISPTILASKNIYNIFYGVGRVKATMLQFFFRGGFVKFVGANVPTDLASSAIRYLFMDEVDRFVRSVGEEGDPIEIARNRMETYSHNYKEIMTSTPTIIDAPIYQNFLLGTQEHYHVPCPHCNEYQKLVFQNLQWVKNSKGKSMPETAQYMCMHCDCLIPHTKKPWMLAKGKWEADNADAGLKTRTFHISRLYSPFSSWEALASKFLESKAKGAGAMRVFVNTALGLPYTKKTDTPTWEEIYNRREEYSLGDKLKKEIGVIVCGIDIQKRYIKAEVYGIGKGLEKWHIDEEVIPGRFEQQDLKDRLIKLLDKTYMTEDGRELNIQLSWIDVGYNTEEVYDWITDVMRYPDTRVIPGVGRDGTQVTQNIVMPNPHNKRQIYKANVDLFKENMFSHLGRRRDEGINPGYIHFGNMEKAFFKELCSETLITTFDKKTGRLKTYWEVTADNGRNEVCDCTVYGAFACVAVLGLSRWDDKDWDTRIGADQKKALKSKAARQLKPAGRPSQWDDTSGTQW